MTTYQPRLPGVTPVAVVSLRVFLHADGFVSHYEVEARGPNRDLVHFRAQASTGDFETDSAFIESSVYLAETVRTSLQELQDYSSSENRPERP